MSTTRNAGVGPAAAANDESRTEPDGRLSEGRFGRGPALKALGAALLGGALGTGARPQQAEAKGKRTKKRRKKCCVQKPPPKPKPAPPAPSTAKVLWATVDASGALVRGSGVTSSRKLGTGVYQINFDREVEECAHVGQQRYFTAFGEIYPHPNAVEPESVTVFTYDTTQTRRVADKDFHLVVTC